VVEAVVKALTRTSDPELDYDYVIGEMWDAMQLVYDEAEWAIAQKADAARPCKAAVPSTIIAANRRTS
jgi:hypothetical protein